jgi:hypothetical protein
MDHIAFFWVGDDIRIPECLVHSVRWVYGDQVRIHQLSDTQTPAIPGVTQVVRSVLSQDIMVARLQAYAALPPQDGLVFYCDADSLFLQPLELDALDSSRIHIIARDNGNAHINAHYPEYYPEFEGKTLDEVMPFLFGGMAMLHGSTFFSQLLAICNTLPARFHRWYGDQVSLFAYQRAHPQMFVPLDLQTFLHIERSELSQERLRVLISQGVRMVTFKGPSTKVFIHPSLANLRLVLG